MRTLRRTLVVGAIGTVMLAGAGRAAAYVWHSYNGHQYSLTDAQEFWTAAEAEAVSVGGHLATVNDDAENTFLMNTFDGAISQGGDPIAWIGYYRTDVNSNDWGWISGEPVTYFRHDYASWPQGGTHVYLHLPAHVPQPGTWNANPLHDTEPSRAPFGIIEVVPEPAGCSIAGLTVLALASRRRFSARSLAASERLTGAAASSSRGPA
jgi:hypothetical protein